eukprot:TRINITY_DN510_c0_g1_i1.p2 TRINITY_DN510_c0_g1~~TRINITY_DN510_c0_g1_i1.p2  ORF type:complete len:103 (+),score=42.71 TRINITY_DN510_c0_g1_i1:28-309(+)
MSNDRIDKELAKKVMMSVKNPGQAIRGLDTDKFESGGSTIKSKNSTGELKTSAHPVYSLMSPKGSPSGLKKNIVIPPASAYGATDYGSLKKSS